MIVPVAAARRPSFSGRKIARDNEPAPVETDDDAAGDRARLNRALSTNTGEADATSLPRPAKIDVRRRRPGRLLLAVLAQLRSALARAADWVVDHLRRHRHRTDRSGSCGFAAACEAPFRRPTS